MSAPVWRTLVLVASLALVASAPAYAQDPPPPPPPEPVVPEGVTIAGVAVAGLTEAEAAAAVQAFFDRRLAVRLAGRTRRAAPAVLGARARVVRAVGTALVAAPGTAVPLEVVLNRTRLRGWVRELANRFNRAPRNARLYLRDLRPRIAKARPGRKLVQLSARTSIRRALRAHSRGPVRLAARTLRPSVTGWSFGRVVVVRRESRRLLLYGGTSGGRMPHVRTFGVAVGQPAWPTPLGRFTIRSKQRNPWWYPPNQPWAAGASPVPPGPGNPLGTRWMGLSIGGIGIHGTYNPGSIGTAASHGCIRMHISESEWLFERVRIGTTVFIVRA
jgi:lipoprotein-anchoring transpeptidase ErfK/SrfK